jgi:hypothetical protein
VPNTTGSQDSLVHSSLESGDSGMYLLPRSRDSSTCFATSSWDFLVCSWLGRQNCPMFLSPGRHFGEQGVIEKVLIACHSMHRDNYSYTVIDCVLLYFYHLMTWESFLKKCPNARNLHKFPSLSITKSCLRIWLNPWMSENNSNPFKHVYEKFLDKEKSRTKNLATPSQWVDIPQQPVAGGLSKHEKYLTLCLTVLLLDVLVSSSCSGSQSELSSS